MPGPTAPFPGVAACDFASRALTKNPEKSIFFWQFLQDTLAEEEELFLRVSYSSPERVSLQQVGWR